MQRKYCFCSTWLLAKTFKLYEPFQEKYGQNKWYLQICNDTEEWLGSWIVTVIYTSAKITCFPELIIKRCYYYNLILCYIFYFLKKNSSLNFRIRIVKITKLKIVFVRGFGQSLKVLDPIFTIKNPMVKSVR